jgi:hypothetical protein
MNDILFFNVVQNLGPNRNDNKRTASFLSYEKLYRIYLKEGLQMSRFGQSHDL